MTDKIEKKDAKKNNINDTDQSSNNPKNILLNNSINNVSSDEKASSVNNNSENFLLNNSLHTNKKDDEKEKNININLINRKYTLLKIKELYENQINDMKNKISILQNKMDNKEKNIPKNETIEKIKHKIAEIENENKRVEKDNSIIEEENKKIEIFFKNFFENNNSFDEEATSNKYIQKIDLLNKENSNNHLIDIFGLEDNNKILAYKKNKLFD